MQLWQGGERALANLLPDLLVFAWQHKQQEQQQQRRQENRNIFSWPGTRPIGPTVG